MNKVFLIYDFLIYDSLIIKSQYIKLKTAYIPHFTTYIALKKQKFLSGVDWATKRACFFVSDNILHIAPIRKFCGGKGVRGEIVLFWNVLFDNIRHFSI